MGTSRQSYISTLFFAAPTHTTPFAHSPSFEAFRLFLQSVYAVFFGKLTRLGTPRHAAIGLFPRDLSLFLLFPFPCRRLEGILIIGGMLKVPFVCTNFNFLYTLGGRGSFIML